MADRIAVMDTGRIVQIGTPEELYNRPATRFVAAFLGEANFLGGRLTDAGPPARIETPLGMILSSDAREMVAGTGVTCCVRPEQIQIDSRPPADRDTTESNDVLLPATIVASVYLGEVRQYTCALDDEERIRWKVAVLAGSTGQPKKGERVHLRISAHHISLLEN